MRSTKTLLRSRVTAIAASLAALAVVAGCASAGASSGRPAEPPSPRTLTVVGDSLTIQGEKPVRSALSDAGWFAALDAFPGRTTATQMDTLRAAAARANDATIVELGTNDALSIARGERTLAQVDADIVAALDLFGDRCVVWVIPDRDPERKGADAGAQVDAVVTREAARRSTVHLADMATVLDRHPDYLGPDRVHLTGEGYEALATVMADAMTACT